MGILSRFKMIIQSQVNATIDQSKDPEKDIKTYMDSLQKDLGAVKAETSAIVHNEQRAKAQLNECLSEVKKLQRYAERSVEAGNDDDARKFLEKKAQQETQLAELEQAYEQKRLMSEQMKQLEQKLISDIHILETRYADLKNKMSSIKAQTSGNGSVQASMNEMEEKLNAAMDRAEAIAELQAEDMSSDNFDKKFAQFEKEHAQSNKASSAEKE